MVRWKRDVIVGILLEIFCAIMFVSTFSIGVGTMEKIPLAQPGYYVRLWVVVFAILSLVMIVNAIRKKDMTKLEPMFHSQVVFTVVLLAAYIYMMDIVGFVVSTIAFMIIIIMEYSWAAGKFKNEDGTTKKGAALVKSILFYVVVAIVVSYVTDYIFRELLSVNLPTWSL